jgi:glycosyltransferase involved in cell wall biosynthesis
MAALRHRGLEVIDGGGGGNFLRTALFGWKADVCHFHWLHPYLLRSRRGSTILRATRFVLEVLLLKLRGARIVWTIHNLANHERRFPSIERTYATIVARLADGVIVHSEGARLHAGNYYRLGARTRVAIIPQGSYAGHYPNLISREEARGRIGLTADDFVFLFLGRIEPYKGVLELIRSFKRIRSAARLLIAGRASDPQLLDQIREELVGTENVRFDEGFVSGDELQTYFNAADVFVFPVRDILNSSSISLAMSFGAPCIAPALEGIESVLGGRGGIFYDPGDPTALLRAMEGAIARRSELSRMGGENLARARMSTWESAAARTDAFYREIVGDGGES